MEELRKQWITSEKEYREGEVFVYRQKFTASQVKKAVFYGTALGVYEAELNGTKIGSQMFAPGFSYYPRRVLYQTHEVTELLREGENTLTVYLGQGWYCGRFLCENQTQIYGEQPAVAWILELEDAAGSRKIVSDETVEELESPYEYAGEYDGEIYFADGRENVTGHAAAYTKETPFALEPTLTEVRLQDEMSVRETTVQGDVTILDFGQNFAGIVEIDPSFLKNETITIRHGEILNADGSLYTANLRKAKATIVYHAGAEKKEYRPRFTYMGFRYMELSGAAYQPGMIRAYALHTEMKRTGYFSCENPLVQKLYENQVWGQKSNYV
ncbi:MAG: family 78 glycoside hydrolase catalytic domain, partial [Roseburia hominis]